MVFLLDFTPIKPEFGLFFWTLAIFLVFFYVMSKFAFKPIAAALKEREDSITNALASADNAREEMSKLKAENETILAQARDERMKMLKDAKDDAIKLANDIKTSAKEDASRIMTSAMQEIEMMKSKALADVKNQTGQFAISIAEKILRKELANTPEQQTLVSNLLNETHLN